jgi:superfamily II DNA or RNA helicase
LFPEPIEVIVAVPVGASLKLIGKGLRTGQVHELVLGRPQLAQVTVTPKEPRFDGNPVRFKLGIEALRLGLAYEHDPYFSLSIARIDPLPHQLEAVYDYFLKLPRIRFLLADDPGAGKTIMAGLLIKELKIRGLVTRTLIVAPANLTFQWQRELKDKFRESFDVMRGEVLRSQYGQNPWQERNQVVTSVSWISRVEDAKDSLLRSTWDLVIVDEAHKMSAYSQDKKTLAFQLGEALSERTDHLLLMTATPHKGDPENFRLFLSLLDRDVYGDVESLNAAMRKQSAPFYLRRLKEALVSFPDPETGAVRKLFTKRDVQTARFDLDGDEYDFYDALTRYVEDQSIKAAAAESVQAQALGFAMAMLQRRFSSSVYAVRKSLERMRAKRARILEDPDRFKREYIEKRLPDDFDDLPEDEQQQIVSDLEGVILAFDPAALRDEIQRLDRLIAHAKTLEAREVESKLNELRQVLGEQQIFSDPRMKLLIFTEHRDTLDYLAGDGRDGRPLGKLRQWNLTVTQIHGGMPIGDRDTPGTRICAEREFKEDCQVLVATEAAGEGINLQFCWLMINYDIPWNPVRLEQRMGRIHRYGQQKDCLIFNFVAVNTREGRVLDKLLARLAEINEELGSDKVFDVVGEMLPSNLLEKLFREMYAQRLTAASIEDRIVKDVDPERFRKIAGSTLEGLAKKELNLSALVGKSVEAKERRLVPEVVEDFFLAGGPVAGVHATPVRGKGHVYRVGRVPKTLTALDERLEPRFGRLGKEYQRIAFDKGVLGDDATLEWVTPGHPLFEVVRGDVQERSATDLRRGAVLWDLHTPAPYRLDVFSAAIKDGRGNTLHRRLFVVRADADGTLTLRQPTLFLDLSPAAGGAALPAGDGLPDRIVTESFLVERGLAPFLAEVAGQRTRENAVVGQHVEISLKALINRQQMTVGELLSRRADGESVQGLEGIIAQADAHLEELNARLERRRQELETERHCTIGDVHHVGRAWVLPHPERTTPGIAPMVRDEEVERIAVQVAMAYEEAHGWVVESVEAQNRGYDLLSRKPHLSEPGVFVAARFIEVKGRAAVGEIALSSNEHRTAQRLGEDYWLYVVFNCAATPELHTIRNPATLGWQPVVKVEHYHVPAKAILEAGA